MRLFLLISIFFTSFNLYSALSSSECVRSDFEASVKKDGALFGLFDYRFEISKKRCLITLKYQNVLNSEWSVDICREPIHLKIYQYFSHKVYMKEGSCTPDDKSTFCKKAQELISLIEREGLVHAKGERETLDTDHGKVFCAYSTLLRHLNDDAIFSMSEGVLNPSVFSNQSPGLPIEDVFVDKEEKVEKKIKVQKEAKKKNSSSIQTEEIPSTEEKKSTGSKSDALDAF